MIGLAAIVFGFAMMLVIASLAWLMEDDDGLGYRVMEEHRETTGDERYSVDAVTAVEPVTGFKISYTPGQQATSMTEQEYAHLAHSIRAQQNAYASNPFGTADPTGAGIAAAIIGAQSEWAKEKL